MAGSLALVVLALAGAPAGPAPAIVGSERCLACHTGLVAATGEDVSVGWEWRASMMAHAARDPYWQGSVRREITDFPAAAADIEGECSLCHMPTAHTRATATGGRGTVFASLAGAAQGAAEGMLAIEGVSCALCHRIGPERLGTPASFTGGFVLDPALGAAGAPRAFGPFEPAKGRPRVMRSASGLEPAGAKHVSESAICASCHTLYTHARAPDGKVVGTMPEQVPFLEWRHSGYADAASCQDCHMPTVPGRVAAAGVAGEAREQVSRHVFHGGNAFVTRMVARNRLETGTTAAPAELDRSAQAITDFLSSQSASLSVSAPEVRDGVVEATVTVSNRAGHKLPTAYPSRRVWLHVVVRDGEGNVLLESGAPAPDGSIAGNDNDLDATRHEPHHALVDDAQKVQIYEAIQRDGAGAPTTGLTRAVGYLKDSRLLPDGFDKASAPPDVATVGDAATDADFEGGGDRVRYAARTGAARGPFSVEARLLYQPISFRWARNLAAYDAPETKRFGAWYDELASVSVTVLAQAAAKGGGAAPGTNL